MLRKARSQVVLRWDRRTVPSRCYWGEASRLAFNRVKFTVGEGGEDRLQNGGKIFGLRVTALSLRALSSELDAGFPCFQHFLLQDSDCPRRLHRGLLILWVVRKSLGNLNLAADWPAKLLSRVRAEELGRAKCAPRSPARPFLLQNDHFPPPFVILPWERRHPFPFLPRQTEEVHHGFDKTLVIQIHERFLLGTLPPGGFINSFIRSN